MSAQATATPSVADTVLARILRRKRGEVAARRARTPLAEWRARCANAAACRGFERALTAARGDSVIAEMKRASPSQGLLRADYQPAQIAADYAAHGACCLSVVTDAPFFDGDDEHLQRARAACSLPMLRKDFIVDRYQLYETRGLGADCVLLIVAAMSSPNELRSLADEACEIGLDVLVEVHDAQELEQALALDTRLIGVNNRDLRNFEIRLATTWELAAAVPEDKLVITESGIRSRDDVQAMRERGVHAFLVGEALMRATSPGAALQALFGPPPGER